MIQNLSEGSKSYHEEADRYERFSQVEDSPKLILNYLQKQVIGKDVLDIGCGTGKYLVPLSKLAKNYIGLDISSDQINIAQSKINDKVKFLCSSAETIDLPNESIDIIISTWVLGTILEDNRRENVIDEMKRVLKKDGKIYLVENDLGGDFEIIRGRYPNISRTKEYNDSLESKGFYPINRFETYFEFNSLNEAKQIFNSIWGKEAADKVNDKKINHNIVIYFNKK
ncbi:class I SAM-dependent methyltransferase [Nanoarchaeota archaeon]